jgi:hypothetical protein
MKDKNFDVDSRDQKIIFQLEKDEDDYPPNDYETLWASHVDGDLYSIDNIPFFVREISSGDVVKIKRKDGRLFFDAVVNESRNSVLRIIAYDEREIARLRQDLNEMGCESELSHIPNLIAVEVPETVCLEDVMSFLDKGEAKERWEYETASLRQ